MSVEHHTVERDGLHWHVVTSGPEDAPPLLLLHCWTGNWTLWERTIQHLNGQYRCIAPDHLGFGGSDKPEGDHYRIDQQAERAHFILNHFGCQRARVVGHSMGGQIALTFAGTYPDAVERLVVIDPAVTGKLVPSAGFTLVTHPLMALARRGLTFPAKATVWSGKFILPLGLLLMRSYFPYPFRQREAAIYWGNQIVADGQTISSAWAEKAVTDWDVTPLLRKISAPTLAIWGIKDWCVPISECDVLAAHIPDFRAVRLPDIGHFPMIEAWDETIGPIETFLRDN